MSVLEIEGLTKRYDKFTLDGVSFTLEKGYIMGFIGRNGAGKTTTLKSIMGLVHKDSGSVNMFGMDFSENEFRLKQRVGFALGGIDYYPRKKLRDIAGVVRKLYDNWDEKLYEEYLERFELDPDKRVNALSAGMRVKFSLAQALSHGAELLLLDEPTSGLDPVSRDEILHIMQTLVEEKEVTILFSTHITSDLEKCADFITYIKKGRILESLDRETFLDEYRIAKGENSVDTASFEGKLIGFQRNKFGFEGMIRSVDTAIIEDIHGIELMRPSLEDIMVFTERED